MIPSDQRQENGEFSPEWNDFRKELERIKELVDRIPQSDNQRKLDNETARMSSADQKEFLEIGNQLLVIISLVE